MGMSSLRSLRRIFSLGSRGPLLLPPKKLNFNVIGRSGAEYLNNVISNRRDNLKMLQVGYGYLWQNSSSSGDRLSVLDFGCAFSPIGQAYGTEMGLHPALDSYFGIDIDQHAIDWCQRISTLRPEFSYAAYNAEHDKYYDRIKQRNNLRERLARFHELPPILGNRSFDLQISSSVFTHLYLEEFCDFLSAVVNNIRTGGVLFNSVFLVDEEIPQPSCPRGLGKPDRDFTPSPIAGLGRGSYISSPENPRASIGFSKHDLFGRLKDLLSLKCETVLYGDWRGVQRVPLSHNYQDWIVLRKV